MHHIISPILEDEQNMLNVQPTAKNIDVDWDNISPVYSPLYESLRAPKGERALLPLERYLGANAEDALKNVNVFAKSKGFKVR